MRKLVFTISFILTFTLVAFSQTSSCPTISVVGSSGITAIGDSMVFTANVTGIELDKIKYNWSFSAGTLASELKESLGSEAVAPFCKAIDSPRKIDEYGKISWRDEKWRLGVGVTVELKNDKDVMALFIIYATKKERTQVLKSRLTRIAKFLTETHKISKDRIHFALGGDGDYQTTIYALSMGVFLHIGNFQEGLSWEQEIEKIVPSKTLSKKP